MNITTTCGQLRNALHRVRLAARGNRDGSATVTIKDGMAEIQMAGEGNLAKARFPVNAKENASIVINGTKAYAVLGTSAPASELKISITKAKMSMKFERSSIHLQAIQDESALLTDSAWKTSATVVESISGKDLKYLFNRVTYAAARNDVRYYLNSVNLCEREGNLVLVATNGHMLSKVMSKVRLLPGINMLIPIEIAEVLHSLVEDEEDVSLFNVGDKNESGFGLRTSSFEMKTPLVAGRYPDWESVVTPNLHKRVSLTVNAKVFAVSIERVRLVSENPRQSVCLDLKDGLCVRDLSGESTTSVQLESDFPGAIWDAGFNSNYLLSSIKNVNGNVNILFDEKNQDGTIAFTDNDPGWCGLVMPLRC